MKKLFISPISHGHDFLIPGKNTYSATEQEDNTPLVQPHAAKNYMLSFKTVLHLIKVIELARPKHFSSLK
jgi:hypothetical protein